MKTTKSCAIRRVSAIALLGAVVPGGTAFAQCKLEEFGEWPVRLAGDQLVTERKAGVPRYAELVSFSDDPGEAAVGYFVLRLMGFPDVKVMGM